MTHRALGLTAAMMILGGAAAATAGHNNPWATAEDTVLSQYHDANQADRPGTGEDRMLGNMQQTGANRDGNRGGTSGGGGHGGGKGGNGGGGKGGGKR